MGWGGLCAGRVRAQAWANRPARLAGPVLERRASPVLPGGRVTGWGVGGGVGGVMSSWGRRGGNDQLAVRAPGYAGEGQVGVWLKEGRSGRRGSEGGRGPLFVGIDLCGVGAGAPRRAPAPGGGGAEVGALGPPRRRGRRPGRPAARAARRGARAAVPFR